MNRNSIIFLIYLICSSVFALLAVLVPFSPGVEVASFLADDDGRFPIFQAVGLIVLALAIPIGGILFIVNTIQARKTTKTVELLDQGTLVIRRKSSLYNGMNGISIFVNDRSKGTVMIGRPLHIELPLGQECGIYAEVSGIKTETISVTRKDDVILELVVGYELIDGKQQLFLRRE